MAIRVMRYVGYCFAINARVCDLKFGDFRFGKILHGVVGDFLGLDENLSHEDDS